MVPTVRTSPPAIGLGLALAAVALGLAGCSHTQVWRNPRSARGHARSAAVIEFVPYERATRTGLLWGRVVPDDNASLVTKMVCRCLCEHGLYEVIPPEKCQQKLAEHRIAGEAVADAHGTALVGPLLGADAVVTGRVEWYQIAYFLFFMRARVHVAMECRRSSDGQACWRIEASRSRFFGHERDLAWEAMEDAFGQLAGQLAERAAGSRGDHTRAGADSSARKD